MYLSVLSQPLDENLSNDRQKSSSLMLPPGMVPVAKGHGILDHSMTFSGLILANSALFPAPNGGKGERMRLGMWRVSSIPDTRR
jgi:hypothetical protein